MNDDAVKCVSSFDRDDLPPMARLFIDAVDDVLLDASRGMLNELNGWEEHDRILWGVHFAPVLSLVQSGWQSEDIVALQDWQIGLAGGAKLSKQEFFAKCDEYGITKKMDERDAASYLEHGFSYADYFKLRKFKEWEEYANFVPAWAKRKGCCYEFLKKVYVPAPKMYYLEAVSRMDEASFSKIEGMPGSVLVNLCLLPLYEREIVAPAHYAARADETWFRVVKDKETTFLPLYQWELVQEFVREFGKPSFLDVRGDCPTLMNAGTCEHWMQPLGVKNRDSKDPIAEVVVNGLLHYGVNVEQFSKVDLYSKLPFVLNEIEHGNYDWLLYARFPKYFNVFRYYNGGSLSKAIQNCFQINAQPDVSVQCAWYNNGEKYVSIYVAFLNGKLVRGGTFKIGIQKASLSTVNYISDVIDGSLRAAKRSGT